jgi:hypothetical protein
MGHAIIAKADRAEKITHVRANPALTGSRGVAGMHAPAHVTNVHTLLKAVPNR